MYLDPCTVKQYIPHPCASNWGDNPGQDAMLIGLSAAWLIGALLSTRIGRLIFKWLAFGLLTIPLVFLAWYMVAAIPISVAILLGAGIIAVAVRSSSGHVSRRLMGRSAHWEQSPPALPSEQQHLHRFD